MKKFKKLIPAMVMLLIATMLMGTTTYAWFSMNNKVTVTGMTVKTKVSNNLMIASTSANNNKVADSAFKSGLDQVVTGTLQPASTDDGVNYYYTYDAGADGAILTGKTFTAVPSTAIINDGATDYLAYVDYVFEIKATNAGSAPAYVNLSTVNLLYNGIAPTDRGYRVAVFVQDQATPSATLDSGAVTSAYEAIGDAADSVLGWDTTGANYWTTKSGVNGTAADAKGTVSNYAAAVYREVAAGKTQYFKFTVRLWLEGEDKSCKNDTYMALTGAWTLDLAFTFEAAYSSAVTQIGSTALATATNSEGTLDAGVAIGSALANGEIVASYQWMKASGTTAADTTVASATNKTYTPDADGTYYCVITTTKGNTYRTNQFEIDVP